MTRDGLVPKKITDKNGRQTTVHVREGETKGENASKLKASSLSPSAMKEPRFMLGSHPDRISKTPEGSNAIFQGEVDEETGASPVAVFRPDPENGGGELTAGIRRESGEIVSLSEQEFSADIGFEDGGSTRSPLMPVDEDMNDVTLTGAEYLQLYNLDQDMKGREDEFARAEREGPSDSSNENWKTDNAAPAMSSYIEENKMEFYDYS